MGVVKISVILSRPFLFFFASSTWKSVNIGRNFDNFPGLSESKNLLHSKVYLKGTRYTDKLKVKFEEGGRFQLGKLQKQTSHNSELAQVLKEIDIRLLSFTTLYYLLREQVAYLSQMFWFTLHCTSKSNVWYS